MIVAIALCAVGVERVVSHELKKLELSLVDTGFGRVRFKADSNGLYRALMGLRAADRVLLEAAYFPGDTFESLFEGVRAVPWETLIPKGMGLRVAKVRSNRSRLQTVTSIQRVVHKAAAERLCKSFNLTRLPEQGKTAELRVYIEKDQVSLLLDISGDPLFKRGYRSEGGIAPLRETAAAAILLLSNWRRKFPLYDPFCGSGTIAIEALMYAWDMAPGVGRGFALSDLLIGNKEQEQEVREELLKRVDFSRTIRIYGSDVDARTVSMARSNTERAYTLARGWFRGAVPPGLRLPDFKVIPMKKAAAPETEQGFIITNPPYGRRVGDRESAETTYRELGTLAQGFSGWKLGLITDHPGFESFFGKTADSCRELTNGALRSYFFQYEHIS